MLYERCKKVPAFKDLAIFSIGTLLLLSIYPSATLSQQYEINRETRIIFIDDSNESGYISGRLESGNVTIDDSISDKEIPHSTDDRAKINRKLDGDLPRAGTTNYSVLLLSRNRNHFAISIDFEEINFERVTNFCEYQELRFSFVGEINTKILEKKRSQQSRSAEVEIDDNFYLESLEYEAEEEEANDEGKGKSGTETDEDQDTYDTSAAMAVSEAMGVLLNTPLNRTILEESEEENDFKIIDTTIDYIYEKTCADILARSRRAPNRRAVPMDGSDEGPRGEHRQEHQTGGKHRTVSRRPRSGSPHSMGERKKRQQLSHRRRGAHSWRRFCCQRDARFKELLSKRLNTLMEWDDFKVVCGQTRRLIVPMRSLKLSVSSDEFSTNSHFKIKYKFISDPSELPAADNGKYFCRNRKIIDLALKCNGFDDCGDGSDESIKVCGYPRANRFPTTLQSVNSSRSSKRVRKSQQDPHNKLGKLVYFGDDLVHCCQSSDWQATVGTKKAADQSINLPSLIGQSMDLFNGPLFAPTQHRNGKESTGRQKRRRVKRIVGGTEAHRGTWPGQVSLQYELIEPTCHFCAGTLVHPQYVLTAGHCITKDGLQRGIKVVLGTHDLREQDEDQIQVRYVDDAQIYPGVDVKHLSYDWDNDMNNDLALLRLNAPIFITQQVAPACLPPFNTRPALNTTCQSIGWGATHGSGGSNLLKHLQLKIVDSLQCSSQLLDGDRTEDNEDHRMRQTGSRSSNHRGRLASRPVGDLDRTNNIDIYSNETMVCVNNDQGHGICQGDSGGPLYCDRVKPSGERCTEIYGVASFIIQYATVSATCAVENLPGIFAEVSSKTEWISSTIKMFEQRYKLEYS